MTGFTTDALVAALAIIGIVIIVSALLSGLIDRSGLPQVAVFLAIGAALGPAGLGVIDITLESHTLRVVATLSLTLVLFTDAVALNISEVRRHSTLALRVLGPGTLLSAALGGFAAWWLLGLPCAGGSNSRRRSGIDRPGITARTTSSSRYSRQRTPGFAIGEWIK